MIPQKTFSIMVADDSTCGVHTTPLYSADGAAWAMTLGSMQVVPAQMDGSFGGWFANNAIGIQSMGIALNTFIPAYTGFFLFAEDPNPSTPYYYIKNDGRPNCPIGEYIAYPWGLWYNPGQLLHVTIAP